MNQYGIIVLTRTDAGQPAALEGTELPSVTVDQLVRNVEYLIADGFDGDTYLIWQAPHAKKPRGLR